MMVRYVTLAKFCELTGYTPAAVYTRKCKGIWPEGTVWLYEPDTKKILIDLRGFEEWIDRGRQTPLAKRRAGRSPILPKLDS